MSIPISSLIDASEFGGRWKRSRIAALRRVADPLCDGEEGECLAVVSQEHRSNLLKLIFENSKKLGTSARWHFGVEWEVSDFHELASLLGVPCFAGAWSVVEDGAILERPGCEAGEKCGSFACDYYREAMEGLVLGLSDDVLFVRHSSYGHGANGHSSKICKDLFVRSDAKDLLFGPLSPDAKSVLGAVSTTLLSDGVSVKFCGESEGTVYYKWRNERGESCRDLSSIVSEAIVNALHSAGLRLATKDITPRAIIGPGASSNAAAKLLPKGILNGEKRKWNQILS